MTHSPSPSAIPPYRLAQILLIIGMFAAAFWFYPQLPQRIPSHWAFDGTVDGWMDKEIGALFLPVMALLLSLFLPFVRHIDPLAENYERFEHTWQKLQLLMTAFFAYVYGMQLAASLQPEFSPAVSRGMMAGMGLLFALLGNGFGKLKHNYFVGIRTPWTIHDADVWNRTHRLAGKLWVAAGLIVFVHALIPLGPPTWLVFIASLGTATVVPIVYSYVLFARKKKA